MSGTSRRGSLGLACLIAALSVTACATPAVRSTVAVVDDDYRFESAGGQVAFAYETADRRHLFDLSGYTVADEQDRIAISDFVGEVVVVNFWASWCGECRDEAGELREVVSAHADAPVQFVGVAMDTDRDEAAAFSSEMRLAFPSIFDPSGRLIKAIKGFPATTIPHTFVLDASGRVAHVFLGAVSAESLDAAVSGLLTESSASR